MFTEYKKMFTDFAVSSEDLTVRTIKLIFFSRIMFFILNIVFIQYALFSKYIMHAFVFLDIEFNRFVPDLDMDSKRSKHFLCILFGQFCLAPVHKVNTHWGQVNIERNAWKCNFVSVLRISAYTVNHLRKTHMPPEQTDVLWRELHLTTRYVRGLDLNFVKKIVMPLTKWLWYCTCTEWGFICCIWYTDSPASHSFETR